MIKSAAGRSMQPAHMHRSSQPFNSSCERYRSPAECHRSSSLRIFSCRCPTRGSISVRVRARAQAACGLIACGSARWTETLELHSNSRRLYGRSIPTNARRVGCQSFSFERREEADAAAKRREGRRENRCVVRCVGDGELDVRLRGRMTTSSSASCQREFTSAANHRLRECRRRCSRRLSNYFATGRKRADSCHRERGGD